MIDAIFEALTMMIVAAVLGGVIVWLLLRRRLTEARSGASQAEVQALQAQVDQQRRAREACADEKAALEADAQARLTHLRSQMAQLQAKLSEVSRLVEEPPALPTTPTPDKEQEALDRVKERAKSLDFNRIGTATAAEKDDLKRVSGIGPFIEKKLNALGIYTFRQIANFDEELEEKVNEAIEFFPGRIRRDRWKAQAAELARETTAKRP